MDIVCASDSSLLVVFGNEISPELHRRVVSLFQALGEMQDERIRNLHPGYASVLIDFDPLRITHQELTEAVHKLAQQRLSAAVNGRTISIPVCYDHEFGVDLTDVAKHTGLSPDEVVRLHTSATYLVYFLGFSPGFGYLGGMPEQLSTPRLPSPRKRVEAGSVGIAGSQTGVYPMPSPGGWRLIGRTPLRIFDSHATPASIIQPGDRVQFVAIDCAAFDEIARSAERAC